MCTFHYSIMDSQSVECITQLQFDIKEKLIGVKVCVFPINNCDSVALTTSVQIKLWFLHESFQHFSLSPAQEHTQK